MNRRIEIPNELIRSKIDNNGYTHELPNVDNNIAFAIDKPIISVIVPVLQEEKLIEKTLKVFTEKLYKRFNIELIVSDGGSTDKTLEIAWNFTNNIVKHEKPYKQTISEGRNNGAEKANGDCLVFLNGDTIPANPEFFFDTISDWAAGKGKYSDSSALACRVSVEPSELLFKDKIFYAIHNSYVRFLNSIGLGMGRGECQIVRKDIFKRVGGYNSSIAAGEDFDLFRRIGRLAKIRFANDLLVYESPRRFRKYGYLKVIFSWLVNSITVWFWGRSVSNDWEAVR